MMSWHEATARYSEIRCCEMLQDLRHSCCALLIIWNEMEDGEEPLNLNETLDAQVTCSLLLKAKMEWLLKV